MSPYEQGLIASLLAGLATGIGGIPVLLGGRLPHRVFDGLVGFAAGAMIVLAALELIPEAFSHGYAREAAVGLLGGIVLALGLLAGPG